MAGGERTAAEDVALVLLHPFFADEDVEGALLGDPEQERVAS